MKNSLPIIAAIGTWLLALPASAEIQVVIGHNANEAATTEFRLKTVPPVSATDAATGAKFSVVDGEVDNNGGGVEALHDGKLPTEEDQPSENFFFEAGARGGRLRVDLGKVIPVKQVNTYSWHPSARGPQVYKLYGSDGAAHNFDASPKSETDPEGCGWKLLATVDTRPHAPASGGGQYGVSISDSSGIIGQCRYLLFDIARTENEDDWGNTFYSEIDVVDANAPAVATTTSDASALASSLVFNTADGKCEITIDTKAAPQLKTWAQLKLAPALVTWYPQIVAMLPSDGYIAPTHFSVTLKPMDGVAFTSGRKIVASSTWLQHELDHESVGALVHEAVHVVQQYGRSGGQNPGWLVEGTADYIRWFKYEPQSHGADIVWLRKSRNFSPQYNASYRVTANFLNWVTEKYDTNIVTQLNAAMRAGEYNDGLWQQYTGKSAPELGQEWRKDIQAQLAQANGSN